MPPANPIVFRSLQLFILPLPASAGPPAPCSAAAQETSSTRVLVVALARRSTNSPHLLIHTLSVAPTLPPLLIMGRYTTVQAYADNNPNMRAVDYAQATGTTASSSNSADNNNRGPVIAEKVDNPYGSTAGAGSGEFHVYRHARAREMARWEQINATEAERKAEEEFHLKVVQASQEEEDKTEKRRKKRERAKDAKRRKKNMMLGGVGVEVDGVGNGIQGTNNNDHEDEEDEEFEYTPIVASSQTGASDAASKAVAAAASSLDEKVGDNTAIQLDESVVDHGADDDRHTKREDNEIPIFANDGSFMERMKAELAG